ncbi:hypothetical protein MY494_01645 [Synechococcus sp. A10-1-5-1]|uniref:hypothetical protein n=1 Tax=Synechococcus sp. A10-1-5-1 TaxID=2936507 RepID=UPI002000A968|nr:hypothetical protein [Synechococcus sp. A10-1-5-1]UPM50529.1 hypothetical protein MY494_01645 [Synechococcus sp. A10-1-5-1]
MGLFDRLLGSDKPQAPATKREPAKKEEAFFLDADTSSSMGNVDFMRQSNTIRRTFPGTVDNPGNKEIVDEVASLTARRVKESAGLGDPKPAEAQADLTGGIPKQVKKTFCEPMTMAELDERKRGSSFGVNVPGGPAAIKAEQEQQAEVAAQEQKPASTSTSQSKAGDIGAFKGWVKDL